MKKITVYCEKDCKKNDLSEVSYEILSQAFRLKKQAKELKPQEDEFLIEALCIASNLNEEIVKKAANCGADKFVLIKGPQFLNFNQIVFCEAFIEYFENNSSDIILFPATATGRMVAPRITTKLNTGLVADCTGLEIILKNNELKLASTRPTFGSELMATILSKKNPQCATVRAGTFLVEMFNETEFDYCEFQPTYLKETRIKTIQTNIKEADVDFDIKNARIILCVGMGLVDKDISETIKKIKKLAKSMQAEIGATRKVVDCGYLDKKHQIGQTGNSVQPELYIAFGVSGALQHIFYGPN